MAAKREVTCIKVQLHPEISEIYTMQRLTYYKNPFWSLTVNYLMKIMFKICFKKLLVIYALS